MRRVKRLYNQLAGPVSISVLRPVLALAGIAALVGCDTGTGGGGGDNEFPPATNPQFATPIENPFGLLPREYLIQNIDLADIDRDGDLDLLFFEAGEGRSISVIPNTGSATNPDFSTSVITDPYGLQTSVYTGDGYYGTSIYIDSFTLGDLDGDGDLDAVIQGAYDSYQSGYGEGIAPVINTGTGTSYFDLYGITELDFVAVSPPYYSSFPERPELTDIDNDGDLDLLFGVFKRVEGYADGSIAVAKNTGSSSSPSFAAPLINPYSIVIPDRHFVVSIDAVDIDGDGDRDLMLGLLATTSRVYEWSHGWLENTGSAVAPSFAELESEPFGLTSNVSGFTTGYLRSWSAFGDLDGDGDLDAITGSADVGSAGSYSFVFQENENF